MRLAPDDDVKASRRRRRSAAVSEIVDEDQSGRARGPGVGSPLQAVMLWRAGRCASVFCELSGSTCSAAFTSPGTHAANRLLRARPRQPLHSASLFRRPSLLRYWSTLWTPATLQRCALRANMSSSAASGMTAEPSTPSRSAQGVPAAQASSGAQVTMREVDRQFWIAQLEKVNRPSARSLVDRIDLNDRLGVDQRLVSSVKRPPLLDYFHSRKAEHPQKVILVRIGEFYEAVGLDALMLIQYAALNPMGQGVPRAGAPVVNLRRALHDLVEAAGLSVVVCEEVPSVYSYGSRVKGKERYIAQLVTPGSPAYVHGMVNDGEVEVDFERGRMIVGLSTSVGGYELVEVDVGMLSYKISTGLTVEGVMARLHAGGLAPPLYVHAPLCGSTDPPSETIVKLVRSFSEQFGGVEMFSAKDCASGLLDIVRREHNLPPSVEFLKQSGSVVGAAHGADDEGDAANAQPKPLYLSTASQLGIHPTRGVPNLLDAVISRDSPSLARLWMRRQMLLPPPLPVRLAVRDACEFLLHHRQALPRFYSMSKRQVAQLVRAREANDHFFREVAAVCRSIKRAAEEMGARRFVQLLMVPASAETGVRHEIDDVLIACGEAIAAINTVIEPLDEGISPINADTFGDTVVEDDAEDAPERYMVSLKRLNEGFRGKVRKAVTLAHVVEVERCFAEVEAAALELQRMASDSAIKFSQAPTEVGASNDGQHGTASSASSRKQESALSYDLFNNAIWLRVPTKSKVPVSGVLHPRDRNGQTVSNRYSTERLERALDSYRSACFAASQEVREQLRALSAKLSDAQILAPVIGACVASTIAEALVCHVEQCGVRLSWALPDVGTDVGAAIELQKFWPYWLGEGSHATVSNSLTLDRMILLTGPNMSGKSTLLRSVCACAVCGSCGFLVPAERAFVPPIDHFMLRNFSSDSPLEGRSSFAVEMHEMRCVIEDVTARSLVLIDELGKGTEANAGAALAGAIVERLDASQCRGIFATHLHALLSLPLDAPRLTEMQMCTESKGGRTVPTMRIAAGRSVDSMAMTVARDCDLPEDVVLRAEELNARLKAAMPSMSALSNALGPPLDQYLLPRATSLLSLGDLSNVSAEEAEYSESKEKSSRDSLATCLRGAAEVLLDVVSSTLNIEKAHLQAVTLQQDEDVPPPVASSTACVYLLRTREGYFYCGETDDIRRRVQRHRSGLKRSGVPHSHSGTSMGVVYVPIPTNMGGKSTARSCESQTIVQLKTRGYSILSDRDGRNHRFATA